MKHLSRIAIISLGGLILASCETAPKPQDVLNSIAGAERGLSAASDNSGAIETLNANLATAEEQMAATGAKPQLNYTWTVAAMKAAETLMSVPGLAQDAYVVAASKTLTYSDDVIEACLKPQSSIRQDNYCGVALGARTLNDTSKSVYAMQLAVNDKNWANASVAAAGFAKQVDEAWPTYAVEAARLNEAENNQTNFAQLALRKTCELRSAKGNLLATSPENSEVDAAQKAYWSAVAIAASFLEISSSTDACTNDPASVKCQVQTEISVADTCAEVF